MSQKFVNEVSPSGDGRKRVAHGVSRGYANPPSPARAGEGCRRRGETSSPGLALGYDLTPLPGLWDGYPKREDFVRLLLTQDTSSNFATNRNSFVPCLRVD